MQTIAVTMLAAATMFLAACSAMTSHPKPAPSWTQRTGQVKLSTPDASIVGDIVIRHDRENFVAEIGKGPGLAMLRLSARFENEPGIDRHMTIVKATGPLAGGGWTMKTRPVSGEANPNRKIHSRPWAALPEVFQWGESLAKRGKFELRLPDVSTHATVSHGSVRRFDYRIHDNPTDRILAPKDLGKLPAAGSVVCVLDD